MGDEEGAAPVVLEEPKAEAPAAPAPDATAPEAPAAPAVDAAASSDAAPGEAVPAEDAAADAPVPYGVEEGKTFENHICYDVVVLGGGPAGLKAAQDAATRGKIVLIVDPQFQLHGLPTGAHSKCLREAAHVVLPKNANNNNSFPAVAAAKPPSRPGSALPPIPGAAPKIDAGTNGTNGHGAPPTKEKAPPENLSNWGEIKTILQRAGASAQRNAEALLYGCRIETIRGKGEFLDPFEKSLDTGREQAVSRKSKTMLRSLTKNSMDNKLQELVSKSRLAIKITGHAKTTTVVHCENVVIASGSSAVRRSPVDFSQDYVFCSDSIRTGMDYMPKKVLIQGGGIIGVEYAQIFAKLGSKVSLLVRGTTIAEVLDTDMQELLKQELNTMNVEIKWKTNIVATHPGGKVELKNADGETVMEEGVDCFLSATGRQGNTEHLGLEALGVAVGRGEFVDIDKVSCQVKPSKKVKENDFKRRSVLGHVYAIGDVAGGGLATQGQDMARRAIMHLCSGGDLISVDKQAPAAYAVWTLPELAYAGLTTREAVAKYGEDHIVTVTVGYGQTVRGIVSQEPGFLKLVVAKVARKDSDDEAEEKKAGDGEEGAEGLKIIQENKTVQIVEGEQDLGITNGQVLGVHIIGEAACELINSGSLAVWHENTVFEVLEIVFPAVTLHELYTKAAAEAKMLLTGFKNVISVVAWNRLNSAVEKLLAAEDEAAEAEMERKMEAGEDDDEEEDTRTRAERTLKMLDDVFVETDIDKSGELDITEIQQMLNGSFSMDLSLEEVKEMVKEIDIDGNGLIDQRELRKAAKKAWVKDE